MLTIVCNETVWIWRTGSSNKLMDVCGEFVTEVGGISIGQGKSEFVSILFIDTEYTRAMKVINNWRRLIRKQDTWTARPGETWLVVWGIACRQVWALRATCTGHRFLYTGLRNLHNRHVFCKRPLHPAAASSKLLRQYVANWIVQLSTTFVWAGTSTARLFACGKGSPHKMATHNGNYALYLVRFTKKSLQITLDRYQLFLCLAL